MIAALAALASFGQTAAQPAYIGGPSGCVNVDYTVKPPEIDLDFTCLKGSLPALAGNTVSSTAPWDLFGLPSIAVSGPKFTKNQVRYYEVSSDFPRTITSVALPVFTAGLAAEAAQVAFFDVGGKLLAQTKSITGLTLAHRAVNFTFAAPLDIPAGKIVFAVTTDSPTLTFASGSAATAFIALRNARTLRVFNGAPSTGSGLALRMPATFGVRATPNPPFAQVWAAAE